MLVSSCVLELWRPYNSDGSEWFVTSFYFICQFIKNNTYFFYQQEWNLGLVGLLILLDIHQQWLIFWIVLDFLTCLSRGFIIQLRNILHHIKHWSFFGDRIGVCCVWRDLTWPRHYFARVMNSCHYGFYSDCQSWNLVAERYTVLLFFQCISVQILLSNSEDIYL